MTGNSQSELAGISRRSIFRGGATLLGGLGATSLGATASPFRSLPGNGSASANDLANQTQRTLRWVGPAQADWVIPRAGVDHNVVVVGGGQSGVGISYWLARKGVGRVSTIDESEPGKAGVWRTIARMHVLNTSKLQAGPARDDVALGFRAWYEALHGSRAFNSMERVPRLAWADYLDWFQKTASVQVRYRTCLLDVEPDGDVLRLHIESDGVERIETTRKLVLATGYLGSGGPNLPDNIKTLPEHLWAHSSGYIDFPALAGKVVGVLGAGSSAFDAAATALESNAAQVHLFSRRPDIEYTGNPSSAPSALNASYHSPGPLDLAGYLPDGVRWNNERVRNRASASVTLPAIERVVGSDRFYLHVNSPWDSTAVADDGKVAVKTPTNSFHFDYVIAGTGYRTDMSLRKELARIHGTILLWGEHYRAAPGEENPAAKTYPYLGEGFQFQAREGTDANYLRNIHCFNPAGLLSFESQVGNIGSSVYYPALVDAIARDLYLEGIDPSASKQLLAAPPQVSSDPSVYRRAIR